MDNDSDLPDGWSMPDDLEKRINELVHKKPYGPEDDLKDALDEMAQEIGLIEPNPVDWGRWVSYFLELLEGKTQRCKNRSCNLPGQFRFDLVTASIKWRLLFLIQFPKFPNRAYYIHDNYKGLNIENICQ